jgi:DNA-binding MarR family transcriptional regulator
VTDERDTNEVHVHTEGSKAFENAKKQLAARDADENAICEVEVKLTIENDGEEEGNEDTDESVDEFDVIGRFQSLRHEQVELSDGKQKNGLLVYPVLRYIETEADESEPVTSVQIKQATGLEATTSSVLSELYGAGLVERVEGMEGGVRFGYVGLTARGKAELERLEQAFRE